MIFDIEEKNGDNFQDNFDRNWCICDTDEGVHVQKDSGIKFIMLHKGNICIIIKSIWKDLKIYIECLDSLVKKHKLKLNISN